MPGDHVPLPVFIISLAGDRRRAPPYALAESVKQRGEDGLLGINAIAETYWQIHRQPLSAWTQEIDLRPFKESF